MKIYVTKNSEYPVTMIGELEAITAIEENKGKLYGILGFWDDKTKIGAHTFQGEVEFISGGGERINYDNLSKLLDNTPKRGKQIVARLLGEDKKFVRQGTPWDIMITSPIQEIREYSK